MIAQKRDKAWHFRGTQEFYTVLVITKLLLLSWTHMTDQGGKIQGLSTVCQLTWLARHSFVLQVGYAAESDTPSAPLFIDSKGELGCSQSNGFCGSVLHLDWVQVRGICPLPCSSIHFKRRQSFFSKSVRQVADWT